MTALLEVENVRVRFPVKGRRRAHVHAVDGVSFRIAKGETLALVGESGSGKTTLARAIVGLVPVEEGSIRYQGEELTGLSERELKKFRRDIAMIVPTFVEREKRCHPFVLRMKGQKRVSL